MGHKIKVQNSTAVLYTHNEISEEEMEKINFFCNCNKKNKICIYLRINLTKGVKDLYTENYKALLKEIEKDTKKWKDIPSSWTERIRYYLLG